MPPRRDQARSSLAPKENPGELDRIDVSDDRTLEEIEMLYRTRFRDFLRVATAIAGSTESGRDAVQDAFLAAIRGRQRYRGEGPLEAWLWRVVVTSALKAHRASRKTWSTQAPVKERSSDDLSYPELNHVRVAVTLLPERQRLVLFLRYYADLDYRTIADALKVQTGTVAAALNAAHQTLRRQIEEVLPVHDGP